MGYRCICKITSYNYFKSTFLFQLSVWEHQYLPYHTLFCLNTKQIKASWNLRAQSWPKKKNLKLLYIQNAFPTSTVRSNYIHMGAVMLKKIKHPKAVTLINLFTANFLNTRFSIQYSKKKKKIEGYRSSEVCLKGYQNNRSLHHPEPRSISRCM